RYQRLDKYFHNLKSWSMVQYVAHGMSFKTIHNALREFYGLHIAPTELYYFKSVLARYYKSCYNSLIKKLLSGTLLHIDETEIKLRTGKCYVWVITNLEEVVYLFKPTREGDFLKDLLKDFHGVLVSDFYAAYDSIECTQQKCLIHLMRDMNQELLSNPYDEEIKAIITPFGSLLRTIVATVDEHGLKRKFLKKHEQDVTKYFDSLSAQLFHSEASEALQKRLVKYRDKLFAFLRHD